MTQIEHNSTSGVELCLKEARESIGAQNVDQKSAKLTLASLIRFSQTETDKQPPATDNAVQESIVRTGAYYFGPMFVVDKGTNTASASILKELSRKGFYIRPLRHLNNAQLNLFFITMKSLGLVSDKFLQSFVQVRGA